MSENSCDKIRGKYYNTVLNKLATTSSNSPSKNAVPYDFPLPVMIDLINITLTRSLHYFGMKPTVDVQAASQRKLPPVSVPIESNKKNHELLQEEPPGDSNGDCDVSYSVLFDELQ